MQFGMKVVQPVPWVAFHSVAHSSVAVSTQNFVQFLENDTCYQKSGTVHENLIKIYDFYIKYFMAYI